MHSWASATEKINGEILGGGGADKCIVYKNKDLEIKTNYFVCRLEI